jgi:hypothetical protein
LSVAAPAFPPAAPFPGDPAAAYRFDILHVRQKLLTIAQRYIVEDEWGLPRFFVVRPTRLRLNILISIAAALLNYMVLALALVAVFLYRNILLAVLLYMLGPVLIGITTRLLAPYRDIRVYADEAEQVPLLLITQDTKIALRSRYTLYEADGTEVARFERDNLASILRRSWLATTPSGEMICRVAEDNWFKALLRRYLGPMYGLLRTNFVVELPDGTTIGQYDRQLTLLDQYTLDLRNDRSRLLDRRVALALSILLDSAESR